MTAAGKQSVKRRIGNTAKVRRGLQHIVPMVSADLEADRSHQTSRFTAAEWRDIERAMEWLNQECDRGSK